MQRSYRNNDIPGANQLQWNAQPLLSTRLIYYKSHMLSLNAYWFLKPTETAIT